MVISFWVRSSLSPLISSSSSSFRFITSTTCCRKIASLSSLVRSRSVASRDSISAVFARSWFSRASILPSTSDGGTGSASTASFSPNFLIFSCSSKSQSAIRLQQTS